MRSTRPNGRAGSRRRRDRQERAEALARYVESGLTQRVFAREEGIGVSTLQYWLRQERASGVTHTRPARSRREPAGEPAAFSLLEVELAGAVSGEAEATAPYEVALAGGTRLRLARGFVAGEVRQLLALLQEGGC